MCGRFADFRRIEEWRSLFGIDRVADGADDSPNYSVVPTQKLLAVVRRDDETVLTHYRPRIDDQERRHHV